VYADAVVTCDPRDQIPGQDWIDFPILVVEVLSPSTERHDRGDKFEGYKAIPTFREYVLIEYRRRGVEVWRRDAGGIWTNTLYGPGQDAALASVSLMLPIDAVYEDSGL
jgi:Uma2 family endonuclease